MRPGHTIIRLRKKYTVIRSAESALFGIAAGFVALSLGWILAGRISIALGLSALVAIGVIVARIRHLGLLKVDNERIAYFLNRKFAGLKDSSDLLILPDDELSELQEIQAQRTMHALSGLPGIILPNRLAASVTTFVATAVLAWMVLQVEPVSRSVINHATRPTDSQTTPSEPQAAALRKIGLTIQPPSYTGLASTHMEQMSAVVPEGSTCSWEISFTGNIERATLQFAEGDSLVLTGNETLVTGKRRIGRSQIYRLQWNDDAGRHSTEYFELRVKADEPPAVQIRDLAQFTRLKWDEKKFIEVAVALQDDFGLTQGHIVATVSKGSGESVKFREEKLAFDSPPRISGKKVSATRRIDFRSLGMDPGDEVYFYAEGVDNKEPGRQRTRTETFFVSLQDTASNVMTVDASLGVDLMPDYFRSQRQIIIDTEKLLKDQPKISKQVFNSTSNELGYDQKVLRLKYGQFLGEEFETNIGAPAHIEEEAEEEDEEDPAKKFGHQHDKDNEHNLVTAKKPEPGHEHDEDDENDPMAAFKHNHDNAEEATFFTQSVRAKLKAALTLMWEAELQLRLFAPKASLPVQYRILNLLKEISQDSRVYVHRMGFDPPPLKEERRLTGDLAEINNPLAIGVTASDPSFPAIRKALPTIQASLQSDSIIVTDNLKRDLEDAAFEIAAVALAKPGNHLNQLSLIRSIVDNAVAPGELRWALEQIQSTCWSILPSVDQSPKSTGSTRHPFDEQLLEELKKPAND
jgi:hypothetical protein